MTLLDQLFASGSYAPLNDEQRQAAGSDRQTIIVSAGAGTGKTQTLVARYLRLLLERVEREGAGQDGRPSRPFDHLLAITYTNAAAAEMRERIDHALRALGLLTLARQIDGAWISTFHGFCERVIRRFAFEAGVDPYFTVLDEDRSVLLRRQSFDETLVAQYRRAGARLLHLLSFYTQGQLRGACFTLADEAAKIGVGISDLQLEDFPPDAPTGCPDAAAIESLRDFAGAWQDHYTALKQQQGSYDFHDLLLRCREVFEVERIAGYYRDQFTEVMLDEAQDTNALQLSLLDRIARRRFIVGDTKQSIYRFQGANVEVFSHLVKRAQDPADADSSTQVLTSNYRSRGEILDYVNGLFSTPALLGAGIEELATGRESQRAPEVDRPEPVHVAGHRAAEAGARVEADWIAREAATLVATGRYQPSDVVVLVAKRRFGVPIADALKAQGLTARIIGTDDYLSLPYIRDARALLEALRNPGDDAAFLSLLISGLANISDRGLYELALVAAAEALDRSLWESAPDAALTDDADAENLRRVCALLSEASARLGAVPLSEIIADIFDLDAPETPPQTRADLRYLCHVADELQRDGGGLIGLIAWFDEKEATEGRIEAPVVADDASDVVRIMTIHAAKGLEFPVVAVACAQDSSDPAVPKTNAFLWRGEDDHHIRLGLKYRPPGASSNEKAPCTPAAQAAIERYLADEEREKVRQLYVACTRAEEVLLLSYGADSEKGVTAKVARAVRMLEGNGEEEDPI